MNAIGGDTRPRRDGDRSRLARRLRDPYTLAFLLVVIATLVPIARKAGTEFEKVYLVTARNLLAGDGMYLLKIPPFDDFTYPPFAALIAIPFTYMTPTLARLLWFTIMAACVAAIWRGAWQLAGGEPGENGGPTTGGRREDLVAVLGICCAFPYMQSGLAHMQSDPLVAALVIGGCLVLERGRGMAAATCFGLGAAIKCTPLLWAPYLACRGRWRAAAWVVAVAVGANLLPDLIRRTSGGELWLVQWITRFLQPMGRADYLPGRWYAWIVDNQSLAGTLTRWGTTRLAWQAGRVEVIARSNPLGPATLRPLVYGLEGVLLLVAGYAILRGRQAARVGIDRRRAALEYGAVTMLMLLLSPMSSRPHYATMLLPSLCLARLAVDERRRALGALVWGTVAATFVAMPYFGPSVGRVSHWCGVLGLGSALLLAGCLGALLSDRVPETRDREPIYRPIGLGHRISQPSETVE